LLSKSALGVQPAGTGLKPDEQKSRTVPVSVIGVAKAGAKSAPIKVVAASWTSRLRFIWVLRLCRIKQSEKRANFDGPYKSTTWRRERNQL
jgi:hypothetical protein